MLVLHAATPDRECVPRRFFSVEEHDSRRTPRIFVVAQTSKRFVEWTRADADNSATGPQSGWIDVPIVTGLALARDELVPCGKYRSAGFIVGREHDIASPGSGLRQSDPHRL